MFVQAGDLVAHVQAEGPADAPVLVLLHSLGTSLHVWDAQAAALAGRFRVVRPDLRGHGLTSVPPGRGRLTCSSNNLLPFSSNSSFFTPGSPVSSVLKSFSRPARPSDSSHNGSLKLMGPVGSLPTLPE